MKVTFYKAPNGRKEVLKISNVYAEDEKFFIENGVTVSMEELAGNFVVYADAGRENEDGDPEEFIEIARGRSCEEVLHKLRLTCEEYFKQGGGQ